MVYVNLHCNGCPVFLLSYFSQTVIDFSTSYALKRDEIRVFYRFVDDEIILMASKDVVKIDIISLPIPL
jgi:5'(3')-deoxyribonucleotidase